MDIHPEGVNRREHHVHPDVELSGEGIVKYSDEEHFGTGGRDRLGIPREMWAKLMLAKIKNQQRNR